MTRVKGRTNGPPFEHDDKSGLRFLPATLYGLLSFCCIECIAVVTIGVLLDNV